MAYIRKTGKTWRAQIERNGVRASGTFDTKAAAEQWATKEEAAILAAKRGVYPRKTLADAFDRYAREVSPGKARGRAEGLRLDAFCRDYPAIAGKLLPDVTAADMAAWRDDRLRKVSAGTVDRDITLISNVFTVARNEWKWVGNRL